MTRVEREKQQLMLSVSPSGIATDPPNHHNVPLRRYDACPHRGQLLGMRVTCAAARGPTLRKAPTCLMLHGLIWTFSTLFKQGPCIFSSHTLYSLQIL